MNNELKDKPVKKFVVVKPRDYDIGILLNHNKKYKFVLKELLRKTTWLLWLKKFDIVMNEFTICAKHYIKYKEEQYNTSIISLQPLQKPKGIIIIKRKNKNKI